MKHRLKLLVTAAIGVCLVVLFGCTQADNTTGADSEQTASGQPPDLSGIWQAVGSAHWDLEGHSASKGPVTNVLGALGGIPAGMSVVEGGAIPYQPWALAKRDENRADWNRLDPGVKCYIPGIPRSTYMPFPMQILQSDSKIFVAYEFGSNSRLIHMDRPGTEADLPSWMGYSLGHWEGDTLVVDVSDQMAETWFDSAGNFHGENLQVTERYTLMGPNHIRYEATIEDPDVFTRPWKISMPLYRRMEDNARLLAPRT